MNRLKLFLKSILPPSARRLFRRAKYKVLGLDTGYAGMAADDIFDQIYINGVWGKDETGQGTSGSGSHDSVFVGPYVNEILNILRNRQSETIVDLGCGDFNVGRHFVGVCKKYYACDISKVILDRNRQKYNYDNVEFLQLDLSKDPLPVADTAFVRQVLQHLGNAEISAFVQKINEVKPFRYMIVSEDIPSTSGFLPNRSKPSGSNTRVVVNSAVVLHEEPFNLQFKTKQTVLEVRESVSRNDFIIRTTLYEF